MKNARLKYTPAQNTNHATRNVFFFALCALAVFVQISIFIGYVVAKQLIA